MAPSLAEYYEGKNILITGATGFIGKVLVEKLLRSFPRINTIYLLMREKKGVDAEERLKALCNNKIFENLREKQPDAFNKLKLVTGDILEEELGISNDEREELQRLCNIVFHSAACVRFDQNLKDAVNMNTKGTLRVLKLAETMENLQNVTTPSPAVGITSVTAEIIPPVQSVTPAFVHLSTAYCRCELDVLEEKMYPSVHDPNKVIDLLEWLDDETLKHLEPKLISSEPNTYSYTKAITENLVAEYSSKFPIAIGRPSIVSASWKEPMPGWVDNLNGPTGLIIGSGKGVIRSMHCEPSYKADAIPVDFVVNACILIAYVTALDKPKDVRIYNLTLSDVQTIKWQEIIDLGKKWLHVYPYTISLWYTGGTIKSYWLTHQISVIFLHLLPAYLVDMLLVLLGKKAFLVNVQKRISHGINVLQYYTTKEWHFRNTNFLSLCKRISEAENDVFYTDMTKIDRDEYLRDYVLGTRHYVLKEDPASLPRARKLHRIRYWVDVITKMLFYSLLIWFLYTKCGILDVIGSIHNNICNYLN